MNVVNLGECKDLLGKWGGLRECILKGEIKAMAVCIKDRDGKESLFFAGDYEDSPETALSVAMAMSWELTKASDFKRSQ